MLEEDNIILKYNQDKKYLKTLWDTESILQKFHACDEIWKNIPQQEKENIQRVAIYYLHIVHSIVTKAKMIWFDWKDLTEMKKFFADLKKHATEITN